MPGSERQNNMFEASPVKQYVQKGNPMPVTSCGRRRNDGSPLFKRKKSNEPRKTTKGKGRNFRTVKEGAGMTAKGVAEYRRKNPGSKLKTAVTGKVKPGSKAAKRRKSFCARMGGMPGPMMKDGKPTRKKLALDKWNC